MNRASFWYNSNNGRTALQQPQKGKCIQSPHTRACATGGAVYAAAIIQSAVYFVFRTKGKEPPKWLAVFFVLLFVGCSANTYSRPEDIIACVAALTCALSLVQERPFIFRSLMFVNGILWCFYDVTVAAYTMIISHLITSASAMIGMIRLDFKKKSANDK